MPPVLAKILPIVANLVFRKVTEKGVVSKGNLKSPSSIAGGAAIGAAAMAPILPGLVPVEYEWVVRLAVGLVGLWMFVSERRA